jgi:selenocysteine lyase/cysteine desulfurase
MEEKVKVTGREAHGGHIRVSPHFYNTKVDIDHFINKLMGVKKRLK